ncbi:MAG: hypothetical protein EBR52_09575, partial [Microbacteriaceae bacterium]|nr:hypothetical protein [Microbacteriaceae bacterium]
NGYDEIQLAAEAREGQLHEIDVTLGESHFRADNQSVLPTGQGYRIRASIFCASNADDTYLIECQNAFNETLALEGLKDHKIYQLNPTYLSVTTSESQVRRVSGTSAFMRDAEISLFGNGIIISAKTIFGDVGSPANTSVIGCRSLPSGR